MLPDGIFKGSVPIASQMYFRYNPFSRAFSSIPDDGSKASIILKPILVNCNTNKYNTFRSTLTKLILIWHVHSRIFMIKFSFNEFVSVTNSYIWAFFLQSKNFITISLKTLTFYYIDTYVLCSSSKGKKDNFSFPCGKKYNIILGPFKVSLI